MSEMKTFVFTDIVRSVDLKGQMQGANDAERDEAFVSSILTPHRERIEQQLDQHGGRVVSTAGDGHFLVFGNTINAASWAIEVQRLHRDTPIETPAGSQVEVRVSLHVGFPQADPNDPNNFVGRVVDYAARLNDHASGGQILISAAALGLLKDAGLDGVDFYLHGPQELRGIGTVDVHELLYDGADARQTRNQPSPKQSREWEVLPATMGLTEYAAAGGSSGAVAKAAPTARQAPVQQLGNYELGELLGAGGMGAVYRARHRQFEKDRAVKIIKPHLIPPGESSETGRSSDGHEHVIRRFYREIKAIGALDHPNIVVAIDSSSPGDETHYLVMEYVDGIGADELVSRAGPLSVAAACEVIRQAAVGLEYLHRQGLVHRDIKPSNLMLTLVDRSSLGVDAAASTVTGDSTAGDRYASHDDLPVGRGVEANHAPLIKILDLGLALLVTDDQPRLTQMGHGAMGTAMYMSPEQWNTTSVDIRADIYGLGCTLYHLLTGRPPFFDSDLRPRRAHERAPIPTKFAGRNDVPKQLTRVLKKMMAKSPDERYTRPAEIVEALGSLADSAELGELVAKHRHQPGGRSAGATDTIGSAEPVTDTLSPKPALGGSWAPEAPPAPLWRRLLTPAMMLLAIGAAFWMAAVARQQSESNEAALRQHLVVTASQAAPRVADEIEKRFDILQQASQQSSLREAMQLANPSDRSTWADVQQWIERQKSRSDRRVPSGSWFIVAANGRQIARAKSSGTIGEYFAYRDYFHGSGYDLDEGATPNPLREQHQSAVYRSKTTQNLKVAFSVPIWGGASEEPASETNSDAAGQVIGVLGMSVDLGDFRLLKDSARFPKPLEVVLIDLRRDGLGPEPPEGAPPRRGLVLHHPELVEHEDVSNPFRLSPDLLAQVDKALSGRKRNLSLRKPIIEGYTDLLHRPGHGKYLGAFEPVVIEIPEGRRDTQWLVIVQQEMNEW